MAKILEFPKKEISDKPKVIYLQSLFKDHIIRLVSIRDEMRAIIKDMEKLKRQSVIKLVKNESEVKSTD